MPDKDPHLLPSFTGVHFISALVYFNRPGLQQDNRIPAEIK